MMERTLALIKPDATARNLEGAILAIIQENGLRVIAMKKMRLTREQAEGLYHVHKGQPFFEGLTDFMISGSIVAILLEGENAIVRWRELMGATDPQRAVQGTIRRRFAQSLRANSVHGSDSPQSANFETGYFFNAMEITGA